MAQRQYGTRSPFRKLYTRHTLGYGLPTRCEEHVPEVDEAQIARLVQQGLTNPEIGIRLFLSSRTVEWHLRNVFGKIAISSRRQLRDIDLSAHILEPPS